MWPISNIFRLFLFPLVFLGAFTLLARAEEECDSGALVDKKSRCGFFYFFRNQNTSPDSRIASRLGAGSSDFVRSIAVVVGVSEYPLMSDNQDRKLEPARIDVGKLRNFSKDNQNFDEVIVLENKKATVDNIEYFLGPYLLGQADFYKNKTRVLFAYSGHGVSGGGNSDAALVLSEATNRQDYKNLYALNRLKVFLESLAKKNFHVLALINSCFGGGMFSVEIGGEARNNTWSPGAHAITAGPDDEPVYSTTGSHGGSIFFETLIRGISSGDADVDSKKYPSIQGLDGKIQRRGGGVVRLGAIDAWLAGQIDRLNDETGGNPATHKPYAYPVVGSVEPPTMPAKGAFFFLQPQYVAPDTSAAISRIDVPDRPLSSVPGHPELKVFNAPASYPVRGIDVSHFNGEISWKDVITDNVKFVYIKATQSVRSRDRMFLKNWDGAKSVGLKHGAYHTFSFCAGPEEQMSSLKEIIPKDEDALPIAVDAEYFEGQEKSRIEPLVSEGLCAKQLGPDRIRQNLESFLAMIKDYYGKGPILYGNIQLIYQILPPKTFLNFPIWIADYSRRSLATQPNLPGTNPWTLWQYTQKEGVKGINRRVDMNVFFGTTAQFEVFSQGQQNVAREAAMIK